MTNYSVKQIAEMLHTNPETVRRWIRAGKLQSVQESKKEGNVISEEALRTFLEGAPKYAAAFAMAAGAASVGVMSMLPGMGLSIGLVAGIAAGASRKKSISEQDAKEISIQLRAKCVTELDHKRSELKRLESEIEEKKRQMQELEDLLSKLEEMSSAE